MSAHLPVLASACAVMLLWPAGIRAQEHLAYTQPAMGTVFRIELHAEDKVAAEKTVAAAFQRVEAINAIASDYLPESELSRLNREPANKAVKVSEDLYELLSRSQEIAKLTEGAFDITAAYAVQQWRRARRQKQLPTKEQTAKAIAMTDWKALQLDEKSRTATKLKDGLMIDLGGIGKGYAVDAALAVLKEHGFGRALVAGSGDLAIGDPPPGKEGWKVSLRTFEKPEGADTMVQVLLKNCGCSTSGDLHQFLELGGARYSHIVNPRTGLGLTDRIACTVIARDATLSDGLATGLCVLGMEKGLKIAEQSPGTLVRFASPSGDSVRVVASKGFPASP